MVTAFTYTNAIEWLLTDFNFVWCLLAILITMLILSPQPSGTSEAFVRKGRKAYSTVQLPDNRTSQMNEAENSDPLRVQFQVLADERARQANQAQMMDMEAAKQALSHQADKAELARKLAEFAARNSTET